MDWSHTKPASSSRLDKLTNLMESLVEASSIQEPCFQLGRTQPVRMAPLGREDLAHLVSEISRTVASLQTFPLDFLRSEADSVVQSVAARLGKHVDLIWEHSGFELPFCFKEPISRALIHSMRNAVDHGIESAERRSASGKSPMGRIEVIPRIRGEALELRITDDGKGPNFEALIKKALLQNAIAPIMADRLLLEQKLELLFLPGLSSLEAGNEVSGRGVGLETIAAEWKKLGGHALAEIPEAGPGFELILRAPLDHFGAEVIPVQLGTCRLWVPVSEVVNASSAGVQSLDVRVALGLSASKSKSGLKIRLLELNSRSGKFTLPIDALGVAQFRSFRKLDNFWAEEGEPWLKKWLVRFPVAFATRTCGQVGVFASAEMLSSLVTLD